jgi:hypothetical protein
MVRQPPSTFVRELMGAIKGTVQSAQRLPGEVEFEYQSSLVASTGLLDSSSARVAALIQRSAAAWGVGLQLRANSDPDDAFETLVDVTDSIFEAVDDCAPQSPSARIAVAAHRTAVPLSSCAGAARRYRRDQGDQQVQRGAAGEGGGVPRSSRAEAPAQQRAGLHPRRHRRAE